MVFPADPEDVAVELFVNGGWTNITSDVYMRDRIKVTRGLTSETADVAPPSSCEFTLNNRLGKYSRLNPVGAYYGSLGQNTPLRVAVRTGKDAFGRTVSNGWADADVGGTWHFTGVGGTVAAANFNVAGGKGTMIVPAAGAYRFMYLPDFTYRNVDVAVTASVSFSDVTGGSFNLVEMELSGLSISDYFYVALKVSTGEALTLAIIHADGTILVPDTTIPGLTFTGQPLRVRGQVEGQTIRAKVWNPSGSEPYGWNVEGGFQFDAYIDRPPGWMGIGASCTGGNSNVPITVSFDDLEIRVNRFHGEATEWPSEWDVSGNDIYVPLVAAGIRRRLSQGNAPLISPYTRANLNQDFFVDPGAPAHLLYFPGEDDSDSTTLAPGLPGVAPMSITGPGKPQLATDSSFPGSAPIGKPNNSRWTSPTISAAATGEIQLLLLLSVPSTGESDLATLAQIVCTGTIGFVDVFYHTGSGGGLELNFYNQGRSVVANTGTIAANVNGRPVLLSVELKQNGGNIDWTLTTLDLDPVVGGSAFTSGVVGQTIGAPKQVYASPYTQVGSSAIGHIALRNDIISIFSLGQQLLGYPGEYAQERIARLCAENDGISNTFIRSSILDGTPVGVQKRKTLLALLDESVKADLGMLHESRDIIGFVHRYGRSLYNQDAVLTLDYASGHIMPPFRPVDDDQTLCNDFTAKRSDGSSYRATQDDGPLAVTSPTSGRGIGRYDGGDEYNVATDDQLPDIATWKVHLGTVNDSRYPQVLISVSKLAQASRQKYLDALAVNLDDRLAVINPKEIVINGTISQIVRGMTETFGGQQHDASFVCAPGVPFEVAEAAADTGDTNPWVARADTDGSVVTLGATAGATTLAVATPSGPLWTAVADNFPLYLDVGGVMVRATACANENLSNINFESGLSPWTSVGASSFTQSATQKHSGSFAGRVVPTGAATQVGITSEFVPVVAGMTVTVSGWAWFTNSVTSNFGLAVNWFNAAGTYLSTSLLNNSVSATTWTQFTNDYTAPAGATQAQLIPVLSGTPSAAQIFYVDDLSFLGPQRLTVDALPVARAAGLPVSVWHLPVLAQ